MEVLRISKNKSIENRNLGLDYSRALAILAVITYHSLNFLGIENSFHGEVGVDAFLFISGYSLVRYNSAYSPQSFLSKRFKRVYLPYIFVYLLFVSLDIFVFEMKINFLHVLASIIGIHSFLGRDFQFNTNMSFWYMGLILPLYLTFGLILKLTRAGRNQMLIFSSALGISLLISCGLIYLAEIDPTFDGQVLPHRIPIFFVGGLLGCLHLNYKQADKSRIWAYFSLSAYFCVSIYLSQTNFLIGFAGAMFLVILGQALDLFLSNNSVLAVSNILIFISRISFELYLVHQYFIWYLSDRWFLGIIAKYENDHDLAKVVSVFIMLILSFLVAIFLHVFFSNEYLTAILSSKKLISVSLALILLILYFNTLETGFKKFGKQNILLVQVQPEKMNFTEPIMYSGIAGKGDLLFLEHNGRGEVRFGIDHWGYPPQLFQWESVNSAKIFVLKFHRSDLDYTISVNDEVFELDESPYQDFGNVVLGQNDIGFTTAIRKAVSDVEIQ